MVASLIALSGLGFLFGGLRGFGDCDNASAFCVCLSCEM